MRASETELFTGITSVGTSNVGTSMIGTSRASTMGASIIDTSTLGASIVGTSAPASRIGTALGTWTSGVTVDMYASSGFSIGGEAFWGNRSFILAIKAAFSSRSPDTSDSS